MRPALTVWLIWPSFCRVSSPPPQKKIYKYIRIIFIFVIIFIGFFLFCPKMHFAVQQCSISCTTSVRPPFCGVIYGRNKLTFFLFLVHWPAFSFLLERYLVRSTSNAIPERVLYTCVQSVPTYYGCFKNVLKIDTKTVQYLLCTTVQLRSSFEICEISKPIGKRMDSLLQ